MAGFAQHLRITLMQADVTGDGHCVDVARLASVLIPVRILRSTDPSREQQPDNYYRKRLLSIQRQHDYRHGKVDYRYRIADLYPQKEVGYWN